MQLKQYVTIRTMTILNASCHSLQDITELKENGADEVTFGFKDNIFSALHGFTLPEIKEGIQICHDHGLKAVVMMNRLYDEKDIDEAELTLNKVLETGVDYIEAADPGLFLCAEKIEKMDHMIYRSETLMTNKEDASWWMNAGCASVVISPLLTEAELVDIAKTVQHTSLMIHGYQLMSVSKRKLLSAWKEASSSNTDVMDNHHLYLEESTRKEKMPVYENAHAMMIYTDFMQASFEKMNMFIQAGVERMILEDVWMDKQAFLDALKGYKDIINGNDGTVTGQKYREKYPDLPLSEGYYGQKTIK